MIRTIDAAVCWRWKQPGYRSTFGPEVVNTLRRMVARWYPYPHRFICVTDDPAGIDATVEVLPDFGDFLDVVSPFGAHRPACYRRLRLFHPDAAQWFGERFVSIDLDTVITGDLTSVWNRPESFVIWGKTNPTTYYNGSMMLLEAGARPQVWTDFDPVESPLAAKAAGQFGSDQAWISYCLGPGEAMWSYLDGVYSLRNDFGPGRYRRPPPNARLVFFHGSKVDPPWSGMAQTRHPWIRTYYH